MQRATMRHCDQLIQAVQAIQATAELGSLCNGCRCQLDTEAQLQRNIGHTAMIAWSVLCTKQAQATQIQLQPWLLSTRLDCSGATWTE